MYKIFSVITGMLEENCYFLCNENNECVVIDPGDEFSKIEKFIEKEKLIPKAVLVTHGHYDHTDAIPALKNKYSVPVYMNRKDEFFTKEKFVVDYDSSETENLKGFRIKVFSTPGHSPGSVCYLADNNLFSGDTLFNGSIGRCDFEGGSFIQMKETLKNIIMTFDDKIKVFPGHGTSTTIAAEKAFNPYLQNF